MIVPAMAESETGIVRDAHSGTYREMGRQRDAHSGTDSEVARHSGTVILRGRESVG